MQQNNDRLVSNPGDRLYLVSLPLRDVPIGCETTRILTFLHRSGLATFLLRHQSPCCPYLPHVIEIGGAVSPQGQQNKIADKTVAYAYGNILHPDRKSENKGATSYSL